MKRFVLAVSMAALLAGCGLRTRVRPPEDTAPVIPGAVTAVRDGDAVVVRWKRAEKSADGMTVNDLAAFVVERRREGEQPWQAVTTVDVVDQEKIRHRSDFSWRDADAGSGAVSYRVIAVCADGQHGPPTEGVAATDAPEHLTPP